MIPVRKLSIFSCPTLKRRSEVRGRLQSSTPGVGRSAKQTLVSVIYEQWFGVSWIQLVAYSTIWKDSFKKYWFNFITQKKVETLFLVFKFVWNTDVSSSYYTVAAFVCYWFYNTVALSSTRFKKNQNAKWPKKRKKKIFKQLDETRGINTSCSGVEKMKHWYSAVFRWFFFQRACFCVNAAAAHGTSPSLSLALSLLRSLVVSIFFIHCF